MPDVTDLTRIAEEMAPLQARLDELSHRYDAVHGAIHDEELAALDVSEFRARSGEALQRLDALLDQLEGVMAVFDEGCDWAVACFPDDDDYWRRLRDRCGLGNLDDALEVVLGRLSRVVERNVKEGDAERARAELNEIVARAGAG